jgi:hypothetical protein
MSSVTCVGELRREAVRQHARLSGIDYLEVGKDRRTLEVHFLGKAPVALEPANVVIEGGQRIRDIRVDRVILHPTSYAGLDDTMEVVTDREGDFSEYLLRVVQRDEEGVLRPHPSFDPHYDRIAFSFKVDCPSDLDCKPDRVCPPEPRDEPEINYLAKDYASFRQLMLDRLALVMPEWRERHVPDLGIAIVELLAYTGDHLSYYQDAVATEAYLGTARQRISVRRHARLVDYRLHEGCNARTWVCLETGGVLTLDPADVAFTTVVEGLRRVAREASLLRTPSGGYEVFEPMTSSPIKLYPKQHEILFYTWGDVECCLPRGARTATLRGRWIEPMPPVGPEECEPGKEQPPGAAPPAAAAAPPPPAAPAQASGPELHLAPGDVLIFEEVIGPKTGARADADPTHRHAVLLTEVAQGHDPLHPEIALTEITWAEEDALPFPVCLSAMGPPPDCGIIVDISVARGNLVLVDHGRRVTEELDPVPVEETREVCDCDGTPGDPRIVAGVFRPVLTDAPLTFREPLGTAVSAARLLRQDLRQAFPQVALTVGGGGDKAPATWSPRRDLLGSRNSDLDFVVEMDDERRAHLRFGDDELGQRPDAGMVFHAVYRVGSGPEGNVGAGAIAHLITREHAVSGGVLSVRNPLPAGGGSAPESVAEAKLYTPYAFRQRLERAVTAEDYAAIVMREFPTRVQRAAASLYWTGAAYEVLVAVDALGSEPADPALLSEIGGRLHRYRRIGHDLRVHAARRVPLDIELRVCVLPGYLRAHIEAALLEVFSNRQSADGRLGFFHPDRQSFGDGVYLSALVAAAQAVMGVESVAVTRLRRLYEAPNDEIENGVLPLGPLEIARVDNDPSLPENGRLRLVMRGGR